jgi:hypothetical protein
MEQNGFAWRCTVSPLTAKVSGSVLGLTRSLIEVHFAASDKTKSFIENVNLYKLGI